MRLWTKTIISIWTSQHEGWVGSLPQLPCMWSPYLVRRHPKYLLIPSKFSHQLLTNSTKVCNSWDPGVVSPSEALVFWSQEAAQRWDLVVIKDHFLGFEAQSAFFLKENHFWINLFTDYPTYRSLWKLLCTKQGCTVFRVSGGEFSPLLSSCKVFVTLSPRYFLHRHIVEENLHFQWPVPGYLNMIKLFHALQYFFLQIFVVSDAGLYQSISEAAG